jgi:hypothetical protein
VVLVAMVQKSSEAGERCESAVLHPKPPRSHHPFEDPMSLKVVGETTAETMSLLSASVENYCPEISENIKQAPGVSSFQYHVLAVDDSRIDQRVIEKLLKTSSYKGQSVEHVQDGWVHGPRIGVGSCT